MCKIPLSKPSYLPYIDEILSATEKVLRSGHIAQGPIVEEFEQRIAEYCGTKYAIAVSSGTAGLFLCLKACGIGPGDEVITTPFSFIASSNVILHTGASPAFYDVNRNTYNINIPKFTTSYDNSQKIIMPVDVFGNPCDTKQVQGIPIIIDACESFGSKIDRPFDAAVYAFYPNKQLTTGEGGCIVTNNKDIAEYCQAMRNQGRKKDDQWLDSSMIGYNFRMTDLQASIGLVQFNHWDKIKYKRKLAALSYKANLHGLYEDNVIGFQEVSTDNICPFVFTVEVSNRYKVMRYLFDHGIECKPYFPCVHLQKPYRDMGYCEGIYPVAEEIASKTLALPFWSDISVDEILEVCKILKEVCNE